MLLEQLSEYEAPSERQVLVLNHIFAAGLVKREDLRRSLQAPIDIEIPYDALVYLKAVNEGIPLIIGAANSAPAAAIRRLAEALIGDDPAGDEHAGSRRGAADKGRKPIAAGSPPPLMLQPGGAPMPRGSPMTGPGRRYLGRRARPPVCQALGRHGHPHRDRRSLRLRRPDRSHRISPRNAPPVRRRSTPAPSRQRRT